MTDPTNTYNGSRPDLIVYDDYESTTDFDYAPPAEPIVIPTYRTFRSALVNTSAIQTISRRG